MHGLLNANYILNTILYVYIIYMSLNCNRPKCWNTQVILCNTLYLFITMYVSGTNKHLILSYPKSNVSYQHTMSCTQTTLKLLYGRSICCYVLGLQCLPHKIVFLINIHVQACMYWTTDWSVVSVHFNVQLYNIILQWHILTLTLLYLYSAYTI